jgi:hypothetical protein
MSREEFIERAGGEILRVPKEADAAGSAEDKAGIPPDGDQTQEPVELSHELNQASVTSAVASHN